MVLEKEDSKPEEQERVMAKKTRCNEYNDGIPILGNEVDMGTTTINTPVHEYHRTKYISVLGILIQCPNNQKIIKTIK